MSYKMPQGINFISHYQQSSSFEESSLMATSVSSETVVVTIDVNTAKDLVCSNHLYLDVRTTEEFDEGHLENSIVVPYMFITAQGREKNPQFLERVLSTCKKDDNIIVGCRSGVRSLQASADLLNAGFKSIKNMGGGYIAWVANGFAVKQPQQERNSHPLESKLHGVSGVDQI